ncbi:MAG: GHKL domain-containing protein [Lachnospiraceae bacterium]|nr:GHKL domain-containing protein [Lachnospiraceae bacterium]
MFSLLSMLIHIVNSIFSAIYTGQFLNAKNNKKITVIMWSAIYFMVQMVIFDVIHSFYSFSSMTGVIINVLLLVGMQWAFFSKSASIQLFVCFSFVAGKEIVKYIASVLNVALGVVGSNCMNTLIMQGKIVTSTQVEVANNIMIFIMSFASAILYALILGIYLLLINKKYVRKEYQLQVRENIFLILPNIAAICISITLKMMIITVENGTTILIYDTVPATLFWIPVICVLLLGAVIANVILFQNVVQYHEENRKRTLLENQIQQMQKEVQEIQDIYADMRGLRHDLRGHINNITQYVKKQNNADAEELNDYIRNMEETVSRLDFGYQTGNPITDIIIHQKKQEADKAGVKFSVDFSYPKELQIDVYDIGVILNNALENAIEAAALPEREKYVSLHSYVKGNLFFVEVENSFARESVINKESGLPESSKANKNFHGMGLANIQRCARKYRGDIDIVIDTSKKEQKIFNLTIMLNGKLVGP